MKFIECIFLSKEIVKKIGVTGSFAEVFEGLLGLNEPSDYWSFELMNPRTSGHLANEHSVYWCYELINLQTSGSRPKFLQP